VHDSSATGRDRVIAKGIFKTNSKWIFVTRYMFLREKVLELIDKYPQVEALGSESSTFGQDYSEGLYGLYLYVAEAVFLRRKDVVYFDPSTVKALTKEYPRPGQMFKSDMVNAARLDTGIKGRFNHNEADAYHVARYAARFWEFLDGKIPEEELTPAEHHTFCEKHTYVRGKKAGLTIYNGVQFKEGRRFFRFSQLPTEIPYESESNISRKGRQGKP
jgi:hypothetical protein